jgi:hypothetical protein
MALHAGRDSPRMVPEWGVSFHEPERGSTRLVDDSRVAVNGVMRGRLYSAWGRPGFLEGETEGAWIASQPR